MNEKFPFDLTRFGFSEKRRDFRDQLIQLTLEIEGIVDHAQMRMSHPCGDDLIIKSGSFFYRFRARLIVCRGIKFLRALCRRHQVKHGIVSVADLGITASDGGKHPGKFRIVHIRLIVHRSSVAYDEDFIFVEHLLRGLQKHFFFFQLKRHLAKLIIQIGIQPPWRYAAHDQFRCRFGDDDHVVSHFREEFLYMAERGRFACARTARNNDLGHRFICFVHAE